MQLPEPLLGKVSALTINTPDLGASLAFYLKLGFKEVMRADWPFPWIQVSDGALLIMLREDKTPYLALTYYVKNIDSILKILTLSGIEPVVRPKKGDQLQRALIESPDGLKISLVAIPEGFNQPGGLPMLRMAPEDYARPEKYPNQVAGMFGELAHPVIDLDISVDFWHKLGFTSVSRFDTPYPWAIVTDGLSVVGLHQSDHFSYPAITYFAADMGARINRLTRAGIKGSSHRGAGSLVVETPEKQHIFLFSLGLPSVVSTPAEQFTVTAVARVQNSRNEVIDDGWGCITSEIILEDGIPDEALSGLEAFSHLEILYLFDRVDDASVIYSGRPRGNPAWPVCGIFAQRKKDRPNRIGLTTVKLISVTGRKLQVTGLDAIDGTPVLDIKPVFREFEVPPTNIRQPEWVTELMRNYW